MSKRLEKYLNRTTRYYWHYYHLKRDSDFKQEALDLSKKIAINLPGKSPFLPISIEDYDYAQDSDKERKLKLIKIFCERWRINGDYDLLHFLLVGDEDYLPQKNFYGIVVSFDEDSRMFTAQIPLSVQKLDIDKMWRSIRDWKKDLNGGKSNKPRVNTFNKNDSEVAYYMWKMLRDGCSWTDITNKVYDRSDGYRDYRNNIRDAKDFFKANGFWCDF